MEKVKRVRADGLRVVKDGCGGLDRGTESRRTYRGWLTQLGTSTSKCTYGDDVDGVHQVKTPVDKSAEAQGLDDQWSRTSGDTRRDYGGSVADTRLHLGLAVSALKPWAVGLPGLDLET